MILSGNNRDKFAGVGAIISPTARPHLLDVIQVNNRILHLAFGKKGGALHVIGGYGPHSGLDLEEIRAPFWETLETPSRQKFLNPNRSYLQGTLKC